METNLITYADGLKDYLQTRGNDRQLILNGIDAIASLIYDDIDTVWDDTRYKELLGKFRHITGNLPDKHDPDITKKTTDLWLHTITYHASLKKWTLQQAIDRIDGTILETSKKEVLKGCGRQELLF